MAFLPYFALSPSGVLGIIGLLHGPDKTIPNPKDDWKKASFDLLIPSYNEEKNIILCLDSIFRQTLQPRQIFLIDDASKDKTVEYAELYAKMLNKNLIIIKRNKNEGKTPSVHYITNNSDADVVGIVDADTVLTSDNYFERLVKELYEGAGIACACGVVMPLTDKMRNSKYSTNHLVEFSTKYPNIKLSPDTTWFQKLQRSITNVYREELYVFLQKFIYHSEMIFFGSIIFPIGCAVVYKREYLKKLLDHYTKLLGFDLTTSEDIFFGFAFASEGYKNIVIQDVYAHTMEPRFLKIYNQVFKWSSSFLQSCYYFNDLLLTPFKFPRLLIKKWQDHRVIKSETNLEKRRTKEAYRQAFGISYTKKYGRNIGWFIFTSALEKISFPLILILMIIFQLWIPLAITIGIEILLYCSIISIIKRHSFKTFFKAILNTPIRYSLLFFDLVIISNFVFDLWISKNRRWRK